MQNYAIQKKYLSEQIITEDYESEEPLMSYNFKVLEMH